jgi:GT2 family glycosyltransferase
LWTQDPRAATLVDLLPREGTVYDLTDDWAAFESDPRRRADVERRVESLAAQADLVLACSRPLEHMARSWSDKVRYLPNAVEAPSLSPEEPEEGLRELRRPRLGYIGTLHSSRLDVELLVRMAELRPAWSFVLLGPNALSAADTERLLCLPNVHYLGVRPHSEVRGYLEGLDVCLLPHLVTPFTNSLDPLKLYEYLAAGRPIVATPVENAPELRDHLAVAASAEEIVAAAERAIAEDSPERQAVRREAVAGATWEARAREVEVALAVEPASKRDGGVAIVIVSYNTRDLLERCLRSVEAQEGVEVRTIVVDNASTDGSVELVRDQFPEVELIELQANAGFGAANNVAFERCHSDFVLLLNSDAFLDQGALRQLVAVARQHPGAAVIGPRIHNPDGTLQRSAWPFPQAARLMLEALGLHRPLRRLGILDDLGTWKHDAERTVDFLIGACLLVRADALAEVGGFDERFWLYGEEADLQRRLTARGWDVVFTPAATATHLGAASSTASLPRLRNFYAGQRRFLQKHGTPLSWPLARLALLVGSLLRQRWAAARVALEKVPTDRCRVSRTI